MTLHADDVFAPLDDDHVLQRLAGGNETEVYKTDDHRHVVKVKHDLGGARDAAIRQARWMRDTAERYTACLGERYTIPNYFIVARGSDGQAHPLTIQPLLSEARPLDAVDYRALLPAQRALIAAQLSEILRRAHAFYRATGSMPDLHGQSARSSDERKSQEVAHSPAATPLEFPGRTHTAAFAQPGADPRSRVSNRPDRLRSGAQRSPVPIDVFCRASPVTVARSCRSGMAAPGMVDLTASASPCCPRDTSTQRAHPSCLETAVGGITAHPEEPSAGQSTTVPGCTPDGKIVILLHCLA
jgi:hypothetical protein